MIIWLKNRLVRKKKGVGGNVLLVNTWPREPTLLQIMGKPKDEFYSNLKDFVRM